MYAKTQEFFGGVANLWGPDASPETEEAVKKEQDSCSEDAKSHSETDIREVKISKVEAAERRASFRRCKVNQGSAKSLSENEFAEGKDWRRLHRVKREPPSEDAFNSQLEQFISQMESGDGCKYAVDEEDLFGNKILNSNVEHLDDNKGSSSNLDIESVKSVADNIKSIVGHLSDGVDFVASSAEKVIFPIKGAPVKRRKKREMRNLVEEIAMKALDDALYEIATEDAEDTNEEVKMADEKIVPFKSKSFERKEKDNKYQQPDISGPSMSEASVSQQSLMSGKRSESEKQPASPNRRLKLGLRSRSKITNHDINIGDDDTFTSTSNMSRVSQLSFMSKLWQSSFPRLKKPFQLRR